MISSLQPSADQKKPAWELSDRFSFGMYKSVDNHQPNTIFSTGITFTIITTATIHLTRVS